MKKAFCFLVTGLVLAMLVSAYISVVAPVSGETSQGKITISGAFALCPLVIHWAEEYQGLNPSVRFDIAAGGAGQGMSDILADKVNIGMVSRVRAANAVATGHYPAPPSRTLYLVTKGKPDGSVQVFLEWILTDGQAHVERLGYVQLVSA